MHHEAQCCSMKLNVLAILIHVGVFPNGVISKIPGSNFRIGQAHTAEEIFKCRKWCSPLGFKHSRLYDEFLCCLSWTSNFAFGHLSLHQKKSISQNPIGKSGGQHLDFTGDALLHGKLWVLFSSSFLHGTSVFPDVF